MSAWAKRKAAVAAETEAFAKAEDAAVVAEQHAVLAEKPEEEVLAELELPNPDEMQTGDDFSAFMKNTVPAALRNRALRTLWRSDPVLANVDMLVDYGEDFTGKNDPIGAIKTIYRVGKGMLPDKEETPDVEKTPSAQDDALMAQDGADDSTDGSTDGSTDDSTGGGEEVFEDEATDLAAGDNEAEEVIAAPLPELLPEPDAPLAIAPRRRMRFEFGAGALPSSKEAELT